jgi:hypothetical protein
VRCTRKKINREEQRRERVRESGHMEEQGSSKVDEGRRGSTL